MIRCHTDTVYDFMHPRTMTLAIVDGLGSLLTGFNPFFHNANHAKNYSQFIDILSNPLAKGLERAGRIPFRVKCPVLNRMSCETTR